MLLNLGTPLSSIFSDYPNVELSHILSCMDKNVKSMTAITSSLFGHSVRELDGDSPRGSLNDDLSSLFSLSPHTRNLSLLVLLPDHFSCLINNLDFVLSDG